MIFTDRKITIRNGKSTINEPVILYRGDYEVSIRFTIMESKFRFKSGVNLVDSEKASHGQLAILTPYGGNVFSEIVKCEDGTVTFTLTKEMIDQLEEVGLYSFQIRLFDYYRESRVSIPPVEFGIEVREPVASEDHDNTVNNAIVGYSIAKVVDGLNEDVPDTFDDNGNYNKTDWETGDRISEGKLNKIEDALDKINQNEKNDVTALDKRITNNFNVLHNEMDNLSFNKVDKVSVDKKIWNMANMGQDVKEAMTGGSVAVVGKNSVLNENIVDGAVSIYKTDFISGGNLCDNSAYTNWYINGPSLSESDGTESYIIPNVKKGATYVIRTIGNHNRLRVGFLSELKKGADVASYKRDDTTTGNVYYKFTNNTDHTMLIVQVTNQNERPIVIVTEENPNLCINNIPVVTSLDKNTVNIDMTDFIQVARIVQGERITGMSMNTHHLDPYLFIASDKTAMMIYETSQIAADSFTVSIKGIHNRCCISYYNQIKDKATGLSLEMKTELSDEDVITFTDQHNNLNAYKYLAIYYTNDGHIPEIVLRTGQNAEDDSKVIIADEKIATIQYVDDRINSIPAIDLEYIEPVEYEMVYGLSLNTNYGSHTVLEATSNEAAIAVYDTSKIKNTFTIQTRGAHNRFIVALCDSYNVDDLYSPVYKDSAVNAVKGNITMTLDAPNISSYKYLLVYLCNSGATPEISLCNSDKVASEGTIFIHDKEIATKDDIYNIDSNKQSSIYKSVLSQESPRATHTEVYADYDALVNAYPNYVKSRVLGNDDLGNELREYVFGTADYNDYPDHPRNCDSIIKKPVVLMLTGTHGYERSPVLGVYRFLKDLCDCTCNEDALMLRDSIIIKIIPVAVPSGYDTDTRFNHNGVNMARNFPADWKLQYEPFEQDYSGPSAASELETQIIKAWIDRHNEDETRNVYFIDWHNTGYYEKEIVYFAAHTGTSFERELKDAALKCGSRLEQYWRNTYKSPSSIPVVYTGTFAGLASAQNYANSVGIKSMTIEVTWMAYGDGIKFGPRTIAICSDYCGNYLTELFLRK